MGVDAVKDGTSPDTFVAIYHKAFASLSVQQMTIFAD